MSHLSRLATLLACMLTASSAIADKAVFAGGCFWCVEAAFQDIAGVSDAQSGFIGGTLKNPTYKGNHKGHYEAVKVTYDPKKISYKELLAIYWVNIDPFDGQGQFCDKGPSYLSAIFVSSDEQRALAESSRKEVVDIFTTNKVVTRILPATTFWPVEQYHQNYYKKNPLRYKYYRYGCGRDNRLEEIWGERD